VVGPVVRAYDPPASPYGAGHRGIDIGAPVGTLVRAPAPGVVYFAGRIGADIFLGIDHGGGLRTTYSWLNGLLVANGDTVTTGQPIAYSGWSHPGDPAPSLHFGVKLGGNYVDPLDYLLPLQLSDLIRLAPL
jgi:murein DD-endopeptidase MepM/ murein hydrolase activator NlpD